MDLIRLRLQFLFAAPNIPLKHQTDPQWPTVKFRPPEFKNSASLSILCCSGTCWEWHLLISGGNLNADACKGSDQEQGSLRPSLIQHKCFTEK